MARTFTDWYSENREILAKKRKLKYRINKDFRQNMKDRSKNYYDRKLKKDHPRTIMILKGKKYLTIGGLAKIIRRNEQTIREYHKDGILPETGRGNDRGWRIYSIPRARVIKKAFDMFGKEDLKNLKEVGEYIHERW